MANYITQLPGELNLDMMDDNDLTFAISWGMDISNYAFEANIIAKGCDTEIPMGITITSPTEGKMNITISASSIAALPPSTNNRWYLNWILDGKVRTVLSGALILRSV